MLALAILFWAIIVFVPIVVGVTLVGLLIWRLCGLPVFSAIYLAIFWSAICFLSALVIQLTFAVLNNSEESVRLGTELFWRHAGYVCYFFIVLEWLIGMALAIALRLFRKAGAPLVFAPNLALALGIYALVAVGLFIGPSLFRQINTMT